MLEPIDRAVVDTSKIVPGASNDHGVANVLYSIVVGYNTKTYPAGQPHPQGWADFWNVEKWPGPRCLRDGAKGTLEYALIADGVAKDSLYPLDVERAFRSLDRLKPHVAAWYVGPAQAVQLLADGEVVLSSIPHTRIVVARKDGAPVDMDWTDGQLDFDWWCIPRGAPHKNVAMEFIASAIDPMQQAKMAELTGLGPSNGEAMGHIAAEQAAVLPSNPEYLDKQFVLNNEWWLDHEAEMIERWQAWKLS
jgi:putative spermidine/putrescine transport system substrate-binding protein